MADLLDIAPSTAVEVVKIGELRIKVYAITFNAMASIASRFPALKSLSTTSDNSDIVSRLIASCGAAVGPIIAAGCGHQDEEAYEQHASQMLPEQQLKLLNGIFSVTFPNGLGPFIESMTALMAKVSGATEGAQPVKVRLKKSLSQSPHSSDADSRPTMQ
jgi:hypothetical protein